MLTGTFSLVDTAVTAAGTHVADEVSDLDGMTSATFQVRFAYGTGGVSARVYIQTTLDQGQTWVDIACVSLGTSSLVTVWGQTKAATTFTTPSDGALTSDTIVAGILGDALRCKWTVTGTYGGSTVLSVRATVS